MTLYAPLWICGTELQAMYLVVHTGSNVGGLDLFLGHKGSGLLHRNQVQSRLRPRPSSLNARMTTTVKSLLCIFAHALFRLGMELRSRPFFLRCAWAAVASWTVACKHSWW